MRRFFVAELPEGGGEIALGQQEQGHSRVLRLDVEAQVELFDGRGQIASARIVRLKPLRVIASAPRRVPSPPRFVLGVGMPKGAKLDSIVRMSAELGVSELVPVLTERAVPPAKGKRFEAKRTRLETIARQAARQSGRAHLLAVAEPMSLESFVAERDEATRLVAVVDGPREPLDQVLETPAVLLIGPEGGLSPREVDHVANRGFTLFGLGPYALRVETAAPVIAGILLSRLSF